MKIISLLLLSLLSGPALMAVTISFQGSFSADDNVQLFNFSVAADTTVTIRSFAYGGGTNSAGSVILPGGFDSHIFAYLPDGMQQAMNDDDTSSLGACDHVTAGTNGCLDSYLSTLFAGSAGSYTVALVESPNTSNGDLSSGFAQTGNGNFTCPQGFCDFNGSQRTGAWAIDIIGADSASAVLTSAPEPASWMLACLGTAILAGARRKTASIV